MSDPLSARYPASAAIRGLCGAFPTLSLALSETHAVIVVPEAAPVPPVGMIVDLEAQLDTGHVRATAVVEARGVVEDDAGDEVFAIDLAVTEIDERGVRALRAQRAVELRRETDGDEAAMVELSRIRVEAASARGDDQLAEALQRAAPAPPAPRTPPKVGYWAPWNAGDQQHGMRTSRRDGAEEPRKRPKPSRHHWEVVDRFRREVG